MGRLGSRIHTTGGYVQHFASKMSIRVAAGLAAAVLAACNGDSTEPDVLRLEIHPAVVDLGSANGTLIDGKTGGPEPAEASFGSQIVFSSHKYRLLGP